MRVQVRRRQFIRLFGGAALSWPLAARAQQPDRIRRVGVLIPLLAADDPVGQARIAALREGLEKLGWTEGRNIRIDTRSAKTDDVESMQRFAKELVALQPDLILTQSTTITATMLQDAPSPSFSRSLPIRSAAASLRAFRSREETSPVSSPWSPRWRASGWSCSSRLRRASPG